MGEAKRRKMNDPNYGVRNLNTTHPKVTKWVQANLYPMFFEKKFLCVYFDELIPLRVFRVPCAIPTKDSEILQGDRVKFRYNLESYFNHQRITCFLKIEQAYHLYLLDVDATGKEFEQKSKFRVDVEAEFDWSKFTNFIEFREGYYLLDYIVPVIIHVGETWDVACENLRDDCGHTLSLTRSALRS